MGTLDTTLQPLANAANHLAARTMVKKLLNVKEMIPHVKTFYIAPASSLFPTILQTLVCVGAKPE